MNLHDGPTRAAESPDSPYRIARLAEGLDHADSLGVLHRQTRVVELIASGALLPAVLSAVTEALEELIPGSRCSVLLLEPATQTLHHGAAPSLPAAYSAAVDGLRIGEDAGSCGAAAHLDTEVVARDIATDRRWVAFRDLALPHGMRSCWSSPIHGRTGTVLGTFAVYHDRPHLPDVRERRLVDRFTHLSAVAIEHAGLYGALTESEERFRRAFEDNAVGMALTDLDGRFGRVNRALREMLDRSEEELLAVDVGALLHPDHATSDGAVAALGRLAGAADEGRAGGEMSGPVQFETVLRRRDGEPVRVAVTASLVRGAGGNPLHLTVNVLDVTARRAAEQERRGRREAELARGVAEAASLAKSRFVSALSHEIRTPLQAITGFTELLGTLDLSPERRRTALGHIAGASSHILALVDDVLDLAAIEAGALPLHVEDLDVAAVLHEVLELLAPVAAERDVTLSGERPDVAVRADARRLRQVLINLVTNGVRYNERGGSVQVTVHRADAAVRVDVTDTGPGIAPELVERLFVPFDRLGVEGGPGVGLGLTLARGLTEAMGGQLDVRSTPGRGTTVQVRLPAADSDR